MKKNQMQKWKKGRGRSDYAGPMIPKMKNSNRERARLLNSPAAKTYMWSSPTHFCSTFRGFRGERKRRELSNRRKKEGLDGRFAELMLGIGEKIEISHLF